MKSSVPCDWPGLCVTLVVLVLVFSPGYFVLVVYLTLGQQNTFPTEILQNREEQALSKEARPAVGQRVAPLGSAWGGQLDWLRRAGGNQPSPAAYRLCGRLAGP